MKILVVDDEQDICEILQYNLETEGYNVTTANSAEEALTLIQNAKCEMQNELPDLILLDVMMGEMSGFEMARRLKEDAETSQIPIVFITALDDEDNTVNGLNIGADDYIAKPLSMKEVKARVKAVLRRANKKSDENVCLSSKDVRYKGIALNVETKTATLEGVGLSLTKLEYELLLLFLENPNKVYGRNDLLARCWPNDAYVLDRTVDVNITRLRKKIGVYGKQIKTRVGYGYYFEE